MKDRDKLDSEKGKVSDNHNPKGNNFHAEEIDALSRLNEMCNDKMDKVDDEESNKTNKESDVVTERQPAFNDKMNVAKRINKPKWKIFGWSIFVALFVSVLCIVLYSNSVKSEGKSKNTHDVKYVRLIINNLPDHAVVKINGKTKQVWNQRAEFNGLQSGKHNVKITKRGYEDYETELDLREAHVVVDTIEMIVKPVVKGVVTQAPYMVGDYYYDGKKEGVVFYVSNGGYHGKIVSLQGAKLNWGTDESFLYTCSDSDGRNNMTYIKSQNNWEERFPAFAWCASLGDEWYLPAKKEFEQLRKNRYDVNEGLDCVGVVLDDNLYWTSSVDLNESEKALSASSYTDYWTSSSRKFRYFVRAIAAF